MRAKPIAIVTDGGTSVSSDLVERQSVVVLPRKIKVGARTLKSDGRTTLRMLDQQATRNCKQASVLPIPRGVFLDAYKKLHASGHGIIAIHAFEALDKACYYARWARQLLLPDVDAMVFEAQAADAGLSFLVSRAAAFAERESVTVKQVYALLERLQDGIQTLLITNAPHQLPCHPALSLGQSVKALIPGINTFLVLDKKQGMFRPVRQSADIESWLDDERERLRRARGSRRIHLRYRGYEEEIDMTHSRLTRLLEIDSLRPERAGIDAARLPRSFIEMVFLPTSEDIRRIEQMVEKWGAN